MDVGIGTADITPPVGVPLSGFGSRLGRPSTEVADPLAAKALAFRSGDRSQVLVSLDLVGLGAPLARMVRDELATALPDDALGRRAFIVCTHTHSGPTTQGFLGETLVTPEYAALLCAAVVAAATTAARGMRSATTWLGSADMPPGALLNRRTPDGPVDPRLTFLSWRDLDGRPIAGAVHLGCHPVVMGTLAVSGDIAAGLASRAAARLGAPCLFLLGAAGDVNPARAGMGPAELEEWLDSAEGTLARALAASAAVPEGPVDGAMDAVEVAHRSHIPRDEVLCALDVLDRLAADGPVDAATTEAATRLAATWRIDPGTPEGRGALLHAVAVEQDSLLRTLMLTDEGRPSGSVDRIPVGTLRLAGLDLALVGAETFVATGRALRAALPGREMLLVSCLSPLQGYLPTAEAVAEGGYETVAWRYYGKPAGWSSDAEEHVRAALLRLLRRDVTRPAPGSIERRGH